jgi:hypothetical protein
VRPSWHYKATWVKIRALPLMLLFWSSQTIFVHHHHHQQQLWVQKTASTASKAASFLCFLPVLASRVSRYFGFFRYRNKQIFSGIFGHFIFGIFFLEPIFVFQKLNIWLKRWKGEKIRFWKQRCPMPSSSALIPMSICTLQCLFSHAFTTYEWLNRDCDAQIYIGITSRWTGY